MSDPPRHDELQALRTLAEVPSFTASGRTGGYELALLGNSAIARMTDPDRMTWEGEAASADRRLCFSAEGRHGERIRTTEDGEDVALFTRRLNRGGGVLELVTGERATLLPVRFWRPSWRVRGPGRRQVAEVISIPNRPAARLTWLWKSEQRSAELAICACFAILVDDVVTGAMPRPHVDMTPG